MTAIYASNSREDCLALSAWDQVGFRLKLAEWLSFLLFLVFVEGSPSCCQSGPCPPLSVCIAFNLHYADLQFAQNLAILPSPPSPIKTFQCHWTNRGKILPIHDLLVPLLSSFIRLFGWFDLLYIPLKSVILIKMSWH